MMSRRTSSAAAAAALRALGLVLALASEQARADCTATGDCATCITQTGSGILGTACAFCAKTGACTDSYLAICVDDASTSTSGDGSSGWNKVTCDPSCPGNPNCPKCPAVQVPHSDKATAAAQCAAAGEGESCPVACADGYSGSPLSITCSKNTDGTLAWSSTDICTQTPCAAAQIPHSDHATGATECEEAAAGGICPITCDTDYHGVGVISCTDTGGVLAWSSTDVCKPAQASYDCLCCT